MFEYRPFLIFLFPFYILFGMIDGARDGWQAFCQDWRDLGDE